jgi:hypothetical protein
LIGRVAQLERRRRKNNIVITGWKGEGKSKQQIKEDIENFIKENREEGNGRVEWKESGETESKNERKEGNREDIHRLKTNRKYS